MSYAKKLFWKNWIVLLLGFMVLILPFLGFPGRISSWLYGILGFFIVVFSFVIGRGLSYAYSAPTAEPDGKRAPLTPHQRAQRVSSAPEQTQTVRKREAVLSDALGSTASGQAFGRSAVDAPSPIDTPLSTEKSESDALA